MEAENLMQKNGKNSEKTVYLATASTAGVYILCIYHD